MDSESILKGFSAVISKYLNNSNISVPIIIDSSTLNKYNNKECSCIYLKFTKLTSNSATLEFDNVNSLIDIFFYPKNGDFKLVGKIYFIENLIKKSLKRSVKVVIDDKEEYIDIFNIDSKVENDEVGSYLHMVVEINYLEQVLDYKEYDIAESFKLGIKLEEKNKYHNKYYNDILHIRMTKE